MTPSPFLPDPVPRWLAVLVAFLVIVAILALLSGLAALLVCSN